VARRLRDIFVAEPGDEAGDASGVGVLDPAGGRFYALFSRWKYSTAFGGGYAT